VSHAVWKGLWIHQNHITTFTCRPGVGKLNSGSRLGYYWHHCAMIYALDPPRMVPTSMSNICKVFDKLHMLWKGLWIHQHHIATAFVGQELGNQLKFWVTPLLLLTPMYNGWGSRPTQNGSHIHVQHMQGVWQASNAVWKSLWTHQHHFHMSDRSWEIKIWVTLWLLLTPMCNGWGSRPTPEQFPHSMSNICNVFDKLHMLYGRAYIDQSAPHFNCICQP